MLGEDIENFLDIMDVSLGLVARIGDCIEAGLAISLELIELGKVFRRVLIIIEEARRIILYVSVAEVI